MFQNLTVFKLAHAMAVHAGTQQAMVARNIAHADSPGYQARHLESFAEALRGGALRADSSQPGGMSFRFSLADPPAGTDPNGNSVSIEQEMLRATDAKRQHDRATAIYKSHLGILRASLGRL
jgi:flagellar basal-body rod protein FlgB